MGLSAEMKIAVIHPNMRSLSGNTRLCAGFCDMLLSMGHSVQVIDTVVNKEQAYTIGNLKIKQNMPNSMAHFHSIASFRKYFPVKYLNHSMIKQYNIPLVHVANIYPPFDEESRAILDDADAIFTDSELFVMLEDASESWARKLTLYVHYPSILAGAKMHKQLLCNSRYTQKAISDAWHLDSRVCYPMVWGDFYKPFKLIQEREYDIVFYSRLVKDKFAKIMDILTNPAMRYKKVIIIGSSSQDKLPWQLYRMNVTIKENATIDEVFSILGNSKVYIHLKGAESSNAEGEHFGISILDAIASGCLAFVPSTPSGSHEIPGVVKYNTINELIQMLNNLDDFAIEFGRRSRLLQVKQFFIENRVEEFEEIIKKM
jgi:glycosyltransferase involved in cell wall biosynthesis